VVNLLLLIGEAELEDGNALTFSKFGGNGFHLKGLPESQYYFGAAAAA
jgi:hypothetical protein